MGKAMADDPDKASDLYRTCGVYLGYGLAQYCEHYKIDHVMILGRMGKGAGGDLMLKTASEVLETEFPDLPKIEFHTADDHFKAVGQCIAAAALPAIWRCCDARPSHFLSGTLSVLVLTQNGPLMCC